MARIVVDSTGHPIVRIVYPREIRTEDVEDFCSALLEVHRTRGPILSIADLTDLDVRFVTAMHRKRVAEVADALAERGGVLAEYVVVPSVLLRAVFTGYSWMRLTKTHPQVAFATFDEAYRAARAVVRPEPNEPASTGAR